MPETDFENVYPREGDIPSEMGVFNDDAIERQRLEKEELEKRQEKSVEVPELQMERRISEMSMFNP